MGYTCLPRLLQGVPVPALGALGNVLRILEQFSLIPELQGIPGQQHAALIALVAPQGKPVIVAGLIGVQGTGQGHAEVLRSPRPIV